jgi:hypothetical protein
LNEAEQIHIGYSIGLERKIDDFPHQYLII